MIPSPPPPPLLDLCFRFGIFFFVVGASIAVLVVLLAPWRRRPRDRR